MEQTKEFKLALEEAELLKLMPRGGALARQFLLLVEENDRLIKEMIKNQSYQANACSFDEITHGMSSEDYQDAMDSTYYMDDER